MNNLISLLISLFIYVISLNEIKIISKRLGDSNLKIDKERNIIQQMISRKREAFSNENTRYLKLKVDKNRVHEVYIFTREMKPDEMSKLQNVIK